jgi:hypothetical protein
MLKRFTRACLLWLCVATLSITFSPTTLASYAHSASSAPVQNSTLTVPSIDPNFIKPRRKTPAFMSGISGVFLFVAGVGSLGRWECLIFYDIAAIL